MKPIKIEEDFINQLTKCSWWLDKNFNIGTAWFSVLYILVSVILLNIPVAFNSFTQTEDFNLTLIILLIDVVIDSIYYLFYLKMIIFLCDMHYDSGSVLANTKLNPNPNKNKLWLYWCRYTCFVPLLFNSLGMISFFSMTTKILIMGTSFYILCVDPIPPGLKKKMAEEKEIENLQPVTSV